MYLWEKTRQLCSRRPAQQPEPSGGLTAQKTSLLREELRNCWLKRDLPDLAEARFLVLDTETTGIHPFAGDELISLGAVVVQDGRVLREESLHRLINPGRPIPQEVQRLTGIREEQARQAPDFWQVLPQLLPLLQGSILVGHLISFDLAFINLKLKRFCGIKLPNPAVDTRVLSQTLHPRLATHTLDALIQLYGIPPQGRHTALGDALITADIFQIFLKRIGEQGVHTLRDLYHFTELNKRANTHYAL